MTALFSHQTMIGLAERSRVAEAIGPFSEEQHPHPQCGEDRKNRPQYLTTKRKLGPGPGSSGKEVTKSFHHNAVYDGRYNYPAGHDY